MQINKAVSNLQHMQYSNFDKLEVIGSGGYGTVYTARYKYSEEEDIPETLVLKCFKSFDEMPEVFISEVSNCYIVN